MTIQEQIETIKAATDNAIKNGTAKQFLIDAGIIIEYEGKMYQRIYKLNSKHLTGDQLDVLNKASSFSKTPTRLK